MTKFTPTGLVDDRNETLVRKVLHDAFDYSLTNRASAKLPSRGYYLQEDYFCVSVSHSVGNSELSWGMWTIILTGMTAYVSAYPRYDFLFEIILFDKWHIKSRKIAAGFTLMRDKDETS